MAEWQTRQT